MTLRYGRLIGALAFCFWALAPSAASAGEGHRGYDTGRHYKGDYQWKDGRHYRQKEYRHHRERHRHARRSSNYRPRHGRRGFEKYVFDDGICRSAYKYGKHGNKYTVRCRNRGLHHHRTGGYQRLGYNYSWGGGYFIQRSYVAQMLESVPDGQTIVWNDSRERAQYKIVPTQTYQADNGRYCREYLSTATVGGQTRQVYGKACRQEDGSWELTR